jgi:hypothetical protein
MNAHFLGVNEKSTLSARPRAFPDVPFKKRREGPAPAAPFPSGVLVRYERLQTHAITSPTEVFRTLSVYCSSFGRVIDN